MSDAVDFLEDAPAAEPDALFAYAAAHHTTPLGQTSVRTAQLERLPAPVRLALEMSAHEELERRALEGELHLLEQAWRDADEIAAIADDMFVPPSVDEHLTRLKNHRA